MKAKAAMKAKAPATPRTPKAPTSESPMTIGRHRELLRQQKAVQGGDTLALAEQQGMKVNPWAKIVSNPWGSMLLQMGAMSAIEPLMYSMGIRSPILGGILPFMAMQSLPGLLESSAGIPRIERTLGRMAERGKLKLPGAPAQPKPAPAAGLQKVSSVAIPQVTTVFG
jgi:hypothetical protein